MPKADTVSGGRVDDLDVDRALTACVKLALTGPHLAPSPEPSPSTTAAHVDR